MLHHEVSSHIDIIEVDQWYGKSEDHHDCNLFSLIQTCLEFQLTALWFIFTSSTLY